MTPEQRVERNIAREMNTCRHFSGISNETCGAGVAYDSVRDTSASPYRWPCLREKGTVTSCEKAEFPTREEAEATEVRRLERTRKFLLAFDAVQTAAKGKRGISGTISCPVCGGTLSYSVAKVNGHIWGACSTKDCVRWMQ